MDPRTERGDAFVGRSGRPVFTRRITCGGTDVGRTRLMMRPAESTDTAGSPTSSSARTLERWRRRSVDRAKSSLSEQDVILGFGLVSAYCAVVLVASSFFPLNAESRKSVVVILIVTAALNLTVPALPGRRMKGAVLLCFPVLLVASELALTLIAPGGEATEFTGFFTLMFVFIGLTQARGVGALFTLIAGPAWAMIQRPWTAQIGVKLVSTLAIWVLISEVLAARTERVRIRTNGSSRR